EPDGRDLGGGGGGGGADGQPDLEGDRLDVLASRPVLLRPRLAVEVEEVCTDFHGLRDEEAGLRGRSLRHHDERAGARVQLGKGAGLVAERHFHVRVVERPVDGEVQGSRLLEGDGDAEVDVGREIREGGRSHDPPHALHGRGDGGGQRVVIAGGQHGGTA